MLQRRRLRLGLPRLRRRKPRKPRKFPEVCQHLPHRLEEPMTSGYQCAGCGEWNETTIDPSAGTKQTYVEDCQVCCKPNVLRVTWDKSAGEYTISAELE